jgi:hypothetical protein
MTKVDCLKYLQTHADFQSPADQALIADALADREKTASKGEVKVKTSKKTKPSLDAIKARAKKDVTAEEIVAAADLHNVDPA